jgi:hypothetical protein
MDLCNLLIIYTYVLAAAYCCYGVVVSCERALQQVTGHTFASLVGDATITVHNASIRAGVAASSTRTPRYFQ